MFHVERGKCRSFLASLSYREVEAAPTFVVSPIQGIGKRGSHNQGCAMGCKRRPRWGLMGDSAGMGSPSRFGDRAPLRSPKGFQTTARISGTGLPELQKPPAPIVSRDVQCRTPGEHRTQTAVRFPPSMLDVQCSMFDVRGRASACTLGRIRIHVSIFN